jgi:O-antigen ligase
MNVLIGRIAAVLCVIFFVYQLLRKRNTRNYVLLSLYVFPFIDFTMVPGIYGAFQMMDFLNYFSLVILFSKMNPPKIKIGMYYLFGLLLLLFLILVVIGALTSEFVTNSLIHCVRFFSIFIYAKFLIDECFNDPLFYRQVVQLLRVSCYIAMGFLAIQLVVGLGFTYYEQLNQNAYASNEAGRRYPGFFQDSQGNAQFMAMNSFLFLFCTSDDMKIKWHQYALFILSLVCIFLTGGRSGLGGFAIGMATLFLFAFRKYATLFISGAIVTVLASVFLVDYFLVFNREEGVGESFNTRYEIWVRAYEIFKNYPFLGIGIGNYLDFVTLHDQEQYAVIDDEIIYFLQPENGYLKLLTELGVVAFLIFILFLLITIVRGIYLFLKTIIDHQVILLIASLVSWMIAFNTVYSILDKRIFMLVTTLTCLIVTYPTKKQLENE